MRLLSMLSSLLGPEEQEVVLGDLAEAGESSRRALSAVLGLVARRQAALWRDWRPWLMLVGFVIPAGVALHIVSRWHIGLIAFIGNRTLREHLPWVRMPWFTMLFLRSLVTLACWSATMSAVVRTLSPRTVIVQGPALFCVILMAQSVDLMALLFSARYPWPHDPTNAWLYEALVPWLVQILLVPMFLAWGMSLRLRKIALFGVAVTAMVFLCGPVLRITPIHLLPAPVMTCVVYWPIAYFAFRIVGKRLIAPTA